MSNYYSNKQRETTDDYRMVESTALFHERCQCGAEFSIQMSGKGGRIALAMEEDSARSYWQLWQENHAVICDKMAAQIAERLASRAKWHAELEAREAEKKRKAAERKAKKSVA